MKLKNRNKGFTLIEIIVVVVILAVLMAVAVPAVMSYLDEADNSKMYAYARSAYLHTQEQIVKAKADGYTFENDPFYKEDGRSYLMSNTWYWTYDRKQPSPGVHNKVCLTSYIDYAVWQANDCRDEKNWDPNEYAVRQIVVFYKNHKIEEIRVEVYNRPNSNSASDRGKVVIFKPNGTMKVEKGWINRKNPKNIQNNCSTDLGKYEKLC